MANVVVNAIGEQCPIPVVKATKALKEIRESGILEVHVDNVLRLASGKNLPAKSEKLGENHFVITMAVDSPLAQETEAAEEPVCCIPDQRGSTVVAVSSATMGHGNDELGKALMKGFIYALSQLEELPRTILFYNGGAHLTVEGSASLEDLKTMEAQGVEIMTCGTCLDFYGLKDKLAVGTVTNMYSIVETLSNASKVIKP